MSPPHMMTSCRYIRDILGGLMSSMSVISSLVAAAVRDLAVRECSLLIPLSACTSISSSATLPIINYKSLFYLQNKY